MPTVTVQWFTGRDAAKKRRVAQGIMAALQAEGVDPAATSIIFQDVEREDWLSGTALAETPPVRQGGG
ncbi:tautomerase family protein [Falsiroseomonas sp. CW058]|uniref:tautomerase family protein n=1 Tax=Falsiroseomonas sp. CW058 TaxID=3388664 RepID=UPI003D319610